MPSFFFLSPRTGPNGLNRSTPRPSGPRAPWRPWRTAARLCGGWLAGLALAAGAAAPGAAPPGAPAPAPRASEPAAAGAQSSAQGAHDCLQTARQQLAALHPPAPADAAAHARVQALQQLQVICQQRVELAYEQERARQQQQAADAALAAWSGQSAPERPDFQTLMALQLSWRENLNQLDAQQQLAQILGKQLPPAKSELEDRQLRARVREQVLKGSADARTPDTEALTRQSEAARLALDVAANQYVYLKDSYELMLARQHILETQGRLWRQKLDALRQDPRLRFGADDLRQVQAGLQREADGLRQRMQRLSAQKATLFESLTRAGRPGTRDDSLFDALSRQWQLLQLYTDLNQSNQRLWQARYALYNGAVEGAAPAPDLDRLSSDLDALGRFLDTELQLLVSRASDAAPALPGAHAADTAESLLRAEVLQAQKQQHATQTNLQILRDEMAARSPQPRQDAVKLKKTVVERVSAALQTIWNYELFSAEDSLNIHGERVVTTRSVTIGKSVGAVLLLLGGYLAGAFVIERVSRLLVRHGRLGERRVRRIGVWIKAFMGISLLVLSISLVRIPLSVFALSGGMLAVGVGFGAQNLIKNTISSLILFLLRPIKSGDFVQVDQYTGTLKSMGWQFCVVRSVDGKENIIPNATFLTSPVTNWTYTNAHVRRSVSLSLPLQAAPEAVIALMQQQAQACPGILPSPAPLARLAQFGDGVLGFEVDFWIDMSASSPSSVDSDLRLRIRGALARAGIELAGAA